jgi:hypothetical protein
MKNPGCFPVSRFPRHPLLHPQAAVAELEPVVVEEEAAVVPLGAQRQELLLRAEPLLRVRLPEVPPQVVHPLVEAEEEEAVAVPVHHLHHPHRRLRFRLSIFV